MRMQQQPRALSLLWLCCGFDASTILDEGKSVPKDAAIACKCGGSFEFQTFRFAVDASLADRWNKASIEHDLQQRFKDEMERYKQLWQIDRHVQHIQAEILT